MLARDVHEWIEARRALEAHERRSAAPASPPDVSWRQALSLIALVDKMIGWPVPTDEVRRREDAMAADAWRRLRTRYRQPA
jgi:predicted ATP-grasp superfamily ATP-dependent carboligase